MMKKALYFTTAIVVVWLLGSLVLSSSSSANEHPEPLKTWRLGVALYSFNRHPVEKSLAMAQEAGAKYVEGFSFYKMGPAFNNREMGKLDNAGVKKLQQMMVKHNIKMSSMYVAGAKDLQEWKNYFELGRKLGLKYLTCEPAKAHWDMIDSLAGVYKIKIAIHQHAKGLSNYWHPDSVLAAIKGHKNIGACADLGHWARSGLDPAECLNKLAGHVIGIHLKDIDEKGNPQAKDVDLGSGVIDFASVVEELKRQRFSGYIQIECEHNFDNNVADIKDAIVFFEYISHKIK